MAARVDNGEVLFSQPMVGVRGRLKVRRPVLPISLEDVDDEDFNWLCKIRKGRGISYGDEGRKIEYRLNFDRNKRKVYVELKESVKDDYCSFGTYQTYDAVTKEIAELQGELDAFRNGTNGVHKLYFILVDALKQVKREL